MTRFVALTGLDGGDIYIAVDKIVSIWRDSDYHGPSPHTEIITVADSVYNEHGPYKVQESPEDVLRLIRNAVNENVERLIIQIDNPVTDANIDEAIRKIKEAQAKLLGA